MQIDQTSAAINHRKARKGAFQHQFQRVHTAGIFPYGGEMGIADVANGRVQSATIDQRPANVAIGHHRQKFMIGSANHRHTQGGAINNFHHR